MDQFISMNRGINDGSDFPADMLRVSVCVWEICQCDGIFDQLEFVWMY